LKIEVLTGRALELRLAGRTYEQIAKLIRYSCKRTYDFVQIALARRHDVTNQLVAQLRKKSLEQLASIYSAHASNVGNHKSAMVMLKIHERKAKLGQLHPVHWRNSGAITFGFIKS
jgi:hypothetical protein